MIGHLLGSPPAGLDPYVLVTIRADSVNALLQRVPTLGLVTPQPIMLPPLSPAAYRDVITKPAAVYTRQVARLDLEPELVEALVKGASGADALPLLAFTLQRLFLDYAPEQTLTKAHYDAMGGIEGSIDRKLAEAKAKAGTAGSDANLRRLIVPALATWDAAANAAKRLVPNETDVLVGDRAGLAPLANALVEARLLTRGGGTLEVAHEALLRRQLIFGWLEQRKDALKLRDGVLREAKEWADGGRQAESLVRRGERLQAALALATNEDFKSALAPAAEYLKACRKLERSGRSRAWWTRAAIYTLLLAVTGVISVQSVLFHDREVRSIAYWATVFWLKPEDAFQECAKAFSDDRQDGKQISKYCPEMVVIPAGSYKMGGEGSSRIITITTKTNPLLAVSRFMITFDQWDACVRGRGCENNRRPFDQTWGRGSRPVINVNWRDAQSYVTWLNRMTGSDSYRLLSEAEWEYAARGVTSARFPHPDYPWGYDIGQGNANCRGCGSQWDNQQTAPVGSFKQNAFGLYDMVGNVSQWVEDCYHENYDQAPSDGSAWTTGDCNFRVVRGGSWSDDPGILRSAYRGGVISDLRGNNLGFRVGRRLSPDYSTVLPSRAP
jgi:formylglycine-generating enzyme required for sulfatase activity